MLMVTNDLYVGWLFFHLLSLMSFLFLLSESTQSVNVFSLCFSARVIPRKYRMWLGFKICPKNHPEHFPSECLFKTTHTDHELRSGDVCLCPTVLWNVKQTVSDLYRAMWKDLNSCKQRCNQCPICFHVPLVWMPFCHFFHPLPSGCLRTSNPEKRALLPKEERSKLDFWVSFMTGTWFVVEFKFVRI